MKISPYTSYLELQPNALLVQQNLYYLQKVGVTAEEWWEIVREDVGYAGATTPALLPHSVKTEEAKWLGSVGMVKRHSKNDLMCHLTSRTMCPLHHRIQQSYPKWVP
jgi:hypothetical protein